jgi:hypothetical protein
MGLPNIGRNALPPMGGNQNIGYVPVAEQGSFVTSGGLGEPTGSTFATYQQDFGYSDDSPFSHGSQATGNSPLTSNQLSSPPQPAFGVVPAVGSGNSLDATQAQITLNAENIIQYAVYIAGGLVLLWLLTRKK